MHYTIVLVRCNKNIALHKNDIIPTPAGPVPEDNRNIPQKIDAEL
jgi:hypothetical protein